MPKRKLTELFVENARPTRGRHADYYDRDAPGLCLRAFATGRRTWMFHYRYDGAFRKITLGDPGKGDGTMSLADARSQARIYRDLVHAGRDPARVKNEPVLTFTSLAARYMRKHARRHKRSAREDLRVLQRDIKPHLGSKPAAEIEKRDVLSVIETVAERGALAQADSVLALLKSLFNWGVAEKLLERNPTQGVRKRRRPVVRDRVLSKQELFAVWSQLDSLPISRDVRDALWLMLLTGQRAGEIIGARKSELQLEGEEPIWIIPASRTKNKRSHTLPLASASVAICRAAGKRSGDSPIVFAGRAGAGLTEGVARRALHRATRAGAFSYKSIDGHASVEHRVPLFGPHDCRRTMATRMSDDLDIDESVIARLLNHAPRTVTGRHYNHAKRLRQMRAAAVTWAEYLTTDVATESDTMRVHDALPAAAQW